jgi:uncharacterized protein (TIGR00369 family)
MPGKPVKESQITVSQLMLPQHANPYGHVHGGEIVKLADEAGALAAMRHARLPVVTLAIDSMTFHSPVQVGDLVSLSARLTWVGRTSLEAEVRVTAENPITGHSIDTHTAYFVYVALGPDNRPTKVPSLLLETEAERRRWAEAEQRRQRRLERQKSQA